MSIAAAISVSELRDTVYKRFVGETFYVALINAPATVYTPGTTINGEFLTNEVGNVGGYVRDTISYDATDIDAYTDEGIPLARKAATFTHDDSVNTYQFTHVVLLRTMEVTASSSGTVLTVESVGGEYQLSIGTTFVGTGVPAGTYITALGTGDGSVGTYTLNNTISPALGSDIITAYEIVSVAPLASQATMSDGNEAVFYFDLKQFGYYQV